MMIDKINITLANGSKGLVGFASFVINNTFYISGVAIFTRLNSEEIRLVYPIKKNNGEDFRLFYPISKDIGKKIELAINSEFKKVKTKDVRYCNNKIKRKPIQNY